MLSFRLVTLALLSLSFGESLWAARTSARASSKRKQAKAATSGASAGAFEKSFDLSSLEACLERTQNEEQPYKLKCPISDFFSKAKEQNYKNPALRYLMAEIVFEDIVRLRQELLGEKQKTLKIPSGDAFPAPTLSQFLFGLNDKPNPTDITPQPGVANPEAVLVSRTEEHMDQMEFWLKPLLEASSSPLFQQDAHLLKFQALGLTLRFSTLHTFLTSHSNFLLNSEKNTRQVFQWVSEWIERQGALPLRDWTLEETKRRRKDNLANNNSDDNFFYWMESLLLEGPPKDTVQRHFLVERLQELWIFFPDELYRKRIRELVKEFKLGVFFHPTPTKDLSLEQILAQVRYLVRKVQGQQALLTLNHVFDLPKDKVNDPEQLWESFKLHVRVLRILDQRERIPDIIQKYLLRQRFLKLDKESPTLSADIQKMLQIARWYWTYEREEEAKKIFTDVVKFNEEHQFSYGLEDSLYYLARISEQNERKLESVPDIEKALASRLGDESRVSLLWRKFFILWEDALKAEAPPKADLLKDLEALQVFAKTDEEKLMWRFWRGRLASFQKDKKLAIKYFTEAYDTDPLSFYGTLSGLCLIELGSLPKNWKLKAAPKIKEPNWPDFFSASGAPKNKEFASLAQAYFYYRINENEKARSLFPALSASLWRYFGSTKKLPEKSLGFAYAVAWLRYAMGDAMGSLQVSEMLRIKNAGKIREDELSYLYPLSHWEIIVKESEKNKISPWMTAGLIRQESAFNPRARSHANALGLMQMIPPVADKEAKQARLEAFDYDDLYKPEVSILLGTQHLAKLFQDFELSFIATFAAYNAGAPPVKKWLAYYKDSDPLMFIERISYQETRDYVKKLLRNYILYQRLYSDGKIEVGSIMKLPQQLKAPKLLVHETANRSTP
jgi:soluble lytic murein transglycosylase-like protein